MVHPKVPPRQLLDCRLPTRVCVRGTGPDNQENGKNSNRPTGQQQEDRGRARAHNKGWRRGNQSQAIQKENLRKHFPSRNSHPSVCRPFRRLLRARVAPTASVFHLRMHSRIARFKTRRRLRSCSSSMASGTMVMNSLFLGSPRSPVVAAWNPPDCPRRCRSPRSVEAAREDIAGGVDREEGKATDCGRRPRPDRAKPGGRKKECARTRRRGCPGVGLCGGAARRWNTPVRPRSRSGGARLQTPLKA